VQAIPAKLLNLKEKKVVTEKGLLGFAAPNSRSAGWSSSPRTPSKPFGKPQEEGRSLMGFASVRGGVWTGPEELMVGLARDGGELGWQGRRG
jgi:hypothetical protein